MGQHKYSDRNDEIIISRFPEKLIRIMLCYYGGHMTLFTDRIFLNHINNLKVEFMKKIILACEGGKIPDGAFEFAKLLRRQDDLLLTGVFLRVINFDLLIPASFAMSVAPAIEVLKEEEAEVKKMVSQFKESCERNGIEFTIHEGKESWNLDEFTKETRFADLVLMSEELFYSDIDNNEPNGYLQGAIHRSECPIMLLPESFEPFTKIVIAYDGKKDTMFALRQFCNLFPEYKDMDTQLVYVKENGDDTIPDMSYIEEYAGRHFSNLSFEKLSFDKGLFTTWASELKNALVITGAYGRSALSLLFKKSFSKDIIQRHRNPLFIAHF